MHLRAADQGREVTLLLAVAAVALTVPYERLRRRDPDSPYCHPSRDRERFETAAQRFDAFGKASFAESELATDRGEWSHGVVADVDALDDPLGARIESDTIDRHTKVKDVLYVVRNALSHGNIATRGQEIRTIRFFSSRLNAAVWKPGDARPFEFYETTPAALKYLVLSWCDFLQSLNLPRLLVLDDAS
jgi:hypothetical protein